MYMLAEDPLPICHNAAFIKKNYSGKTLSTSTEYPTSNSRSILIRLITLQINIVRMFGLSEITQLSRSAFFIVKNAYPSRAQPHHT